MGDPLQRLPSGRAHRVWTAALLALATTAAAPRGAMAQDSHYWAEQYGVKASLLGGAMIGSVEDMSGAYYNPGALALHRDAGFVLSGRAYRQGKLTVEDGAGPGQPLTSTNQSPIPTLLATPLEFSWLGRHTLVYSILTRQQFDAGLGAERIDTLDLLPGAPGDEAVAAAYRADASLRDTWTGLTWAYPIAEGFGIGVTQFLAIRNQSISSRLLLQTATEAGEVGIATRIRDRSYKHYRTLTKVGATFETGRYSFGVTGTTPSISLKGDGDAAFNGSAAGLDIDQDGTTDPYLAASIQSDVPATFKSGWSAGGGLGVRLGSTRLHASTEWFEAVPRQVVLDAAPVIPQTGPGTVDNRGTFVSNSVLNWGVGLEQTLGRFALFGGIASDNSAGVRGADPNTDLVVTTYDLMRYSGGSSFRLGRWDIMLGLGYARGSQAFDVPSLEPLPPEEPLRLRYTQWTVVLGFERVSAETAN